MTLTVDQRNSPVWGVIHAQLVRRVADLQRELEKPGALDSTNIIRGRLLELRGILIADEDVPMQEGESYQSF